MGSYRRATAGQFTLGTLGGRPCATWAENGRRRRFRLSAEPVGQAAAEALLQQFARQRGRMADVATVTVQAIHDAYLADRRLDGKPTANAVNSWKQLGPTFGHLSPDDIDKGLCRDYQRRRLAQGRKVGTVWSELVMLRTFLNWAAKARMIATAPHVTIPPKPEPRDLFLTREQVSALLAAAEHHHVALYIVLAVSTAARMGAILDLEWSRVDFAAGLIQLHNPARPRTHKGRAIVPMNNSARAALTEARAGALTGHVIEWNGERVRSIKKGLAAAARKAGVVCSPHVLRHSAGRFMAEDGVPMEEIAAYMGHSTPSVTARVYARYSPDYLRKAAGALELPSLRRVR